MFQLSGFIVSSTNVCPWRFGVFLIALNSPGPIQKYFTHIELNETTLK